VVWMQADALSSWMTFSHGWKKVSQALITDGDLQGTRGGRRPLDAAAWPLEPLLAARRSGEPEHRKAATPHRPPAHLFGPKRVRHCFEPAWMELLGPLERLARPPPVAIEAVYVERQAKVWPVCFFR